MPGNIWLILLASVAVSGGFGGRGRRGRGCEVSAARAGTYMIACSVIETEVPRRPSARTI
jgi:hypothetical protein